MEERDWEKENWVILGKKKGRNRSHQEYKGGGGVLSTKSLQQIPCNVVGSDMVAEPIPREEQGEGDACGLARPMMGPRDESVGEEGGKVDFSKPCDLTVSRKGKRYGHFSGF